MIAAALLLALAQPPAAAPSSGVPSSAELASDARNILGAPTGPAPLSPARSSGARHWSRWVPSGE